MLSYLVHVMGDVHQPLHSCALFNENFKKGDMGGNLFKIPYSGEIRNLHSFFDSGAGQLHNSLEIVKSFL